MVLSQAPSFPCTHSYSLSLILLIPFTPMPRIFFSLPPLLPLLPTHWLSWLLPSPASLLLCLPNSLQLPHSLVANSLSSRIVDKEFYCISNSSVINKTFIRLGKRKIQKQLMVSSHDRIYPQQKQPLHLLFLQRGTMNRYIHNVSLISH